MSLPVIILGSGGHARVLLDSLLLQSFDVIGLTDSCPFRDKNVLGVNIIGDDDSILLGYPPDTVDLVNGLGSIKETLKRRLLYDKFKGLGYNFAIVIHPSAIIAGSVYLGEGAQIMAGAVIQPGSIIGRNTIINTRASVDHDCVVGDHVHVAPGVTLSGNVQVGDEVHIGTGAAVIQGISIGEKSTIGAGTLVIRDVPGNVTVIGSPARVIKEGEG
jgi:UDP-perosamine 4-acetyltransferase